MTNLLTKTSAGIQAEQAAELAQTGMSPIQGLILDTAPTQDLANPVPLIGYEGPIVRRTLEVEGITSYYISIPPYVDIHIRGVGLTLQDGTLYKYCRYNEEDDGFEKRPGTSLSLKVYNDIRNSTEVPNINYTIIDDVAIAQQIKEQLVPQVAEQAQELVNADYRITGLMRLATLEHLTGSKIF